MVIASFSYDKEEKAWHMGHHPCLLTAGIVMTPRFFEPQILFQYKDPNSCDQSPGSGMDDEICF